MQERIQGWSSTLIHPNPTNPTTNHIIKFKVSQGKGKFKEEKRSQMVPFEKIFSDNYRDISNVKGEREREREEGVRRGRRQGVRRKKQFKLTVSSSSMDKMILSYYPCLLHYLFSYEKNINHSTSRKLRLDHLMAIANKLI